MRAEEAGGSQPPGRRKVIKSDRDNPRHSKEKILLQIKSREEVTRKQLIFQIKDLKL
jgi:hypothetical protein